MPPAYVAPLVASLKSAPKPIANNVGVPTTLVAGVDVHPPVALGHLDDVDRLEADDVVGSGPHDIWRDQIAVVRRRGCSAARRGAGDELAAGIEHLAVDVDTRAVDVGVTTPPVFPYHERAFRVRGDRRMDGIGRCGSRRFRTRNREAARTGDGQRQDESTQSHTDLPRDRMDRW